MSAIKPLSKPALAVFRVLTEGVDKVGDHRKIDNTNGSFMPVSIEAVGTTHRGQLIVSIAHYYEQNGDLMADPEITFVVAREDYVYPVSYKQDGLGIDRQYVRWEGDKMLVDISDQNDVSRFCTTWMRNIKNQQFDGKLPKIKLATAA